MTSLDLDAISALLSREPTAVCLRCRRAGPDPKTHGHGRSGCISCMCSHPPECLCGGCEDRAVALIGSVPRLVAEVRRLREALREIYLMGCAGIHPGPCACGAMAQMADATLGSTHAE